MTPSAADWEDILFAHLHPLKVAVIEALLWIDLPLSPRNLSDLFHPDVALNNLAYHVRSLAEDGVILEVTTLPRRGAIEHFYRLSG